LNDVETEITAEITAKAFSSTDPDDQTVGDPFYATGAAHKKGNGGKPGA
jgi:hypothetical protein